MLTSLLSTANTAVRCLRAPAQLMKSANYPGAPLSNIFGTFSPLRAFSSTSDALVKRKAKDPKLKTHKASLKRFLLLPDGRWIRAKGGHSHKNAKKSPERIARLRKPAVASPTQAKFLETVLPYTKRADRRFFEPIDD